jgi:hypothetical protein
LGQKSHEHRAIYMETWQGLDADSIVGVAQSHPLSALVD